MIVINTLTLFTDERGQMSHDNVQVNFEQFCRIVSELNLNCDKKYSNGHIDRK